MPTHKKLNPVGQLIEQVKDAEAWRGKRMSDEDIVARAQQRNHPLTKQNLSRIRYAKQLTVSGPFIGHLAAGLDVPPERVIAAYLAAFGYPAMDRLRITIETAVREDERLPSHDKAVLLDVLKSLLKRHRLDQQGKELPLREASPGDKSDSVKTRRSGPPRLARKATPPTKGTNHGEEAAGEKGQEEGQANRPL